jgi:hypothetical protein
LGRAVSGRRMSDALSTAPGKILRIEAAAQAVSILVADTRGGRQRRAVSLRKSRGASFDVRPRSRLSNTGPAGAKSPAGERVTGPADARPAGQPRGRPAHHLQAPDSLGHRDGDRHNTSNPEFLGAPEEFGQSGQP